MAKGMGNGFPIAAVVTSKGNDLIVRTKEQTNIYKQTFKSSCSLQCSTADDKKIQL